MVKVYDDDCNIICIWGKREETIKRAALVSAAPEMYELLDELDKAASAVEIEALYARIPVLLKKARGEK